MYGVSGNRELCKDRIENAAKSVNGVASAVWVVKSKKIHVGFNIMETANKPLKKCKPKPVQYNTI